MNMYCTVKDNKIYMGSNINTYVFKLRLYIHTGNMFYQTGRKSKIVNSNKNETLLFNVS